MRYLSIIILALFTASCTKNTKVEFTGSTPGVKSGVFSVRDLKGVIIAGDNIIDEKFHTTKIVDTPGYFRLDVTDDADKKNPHVPFDVYIEGGSYTIEAHAGKMDKYPKITSTSAIQNELSAFYTLADSMSASAHLLTEKYTRDIQTLKTGPVHKKEYVDLDAKLAIARNNEAQILSAALEKFVAQYPQNQVGAHVMEKMDYETDPVPYYKIYQKFTDAVKNTDEGKEVGTKLSQLVKLVKGATAPAITGNMPDGKPFDPASMHKKIYLIDFWRAGDEISRNNHKELINRILPKEIVDKGNLGIISISLDPKEDWWQTALKQDNMSWTQVNDLKGDDSPNVDNWSISRVPTYYLVSGDWHILERDVTFAAVSFDVNDYLKKH